MPATLDQDAWIRDAFGEDPAAYAEAASAPPASAQIDPAILNACAKASSVWLGICRKVESDIETLRGKFAAAFGDHEASDQIVSAFDKRVRTVIDRFDEELARKLAAISKGTKPAEHERQLAEIRSTIQSYLAYVQSDPTLVELDKNPFVPLALTPVLTSALTTLSKTLA